MKGSANSDQRQPVKSGGHCLVAVCLLGLLTALHAQTAPRTFTSNDGNSQFRYSPLLVHCTPAQTVEGNPRSWIPADDCLSQDPICEDVERLSTIACFAYPKSRFEGKPTFIAAAFFVAEVEKAGTENICLSGSPSWNTEGTKHHGSRALRVRVFQISDSWAGGGQLGHIYRAFHNKRCYELSIQIATSSSGGFDPGTIKEFTKQDWDDVFGTLTQVIDSFKSLK
jgi:hypothetical protein